jgi:murein DD-endopeptidase MepM/ murein hydrolase activator NlpD
MRFFPPKAADRMGVMATTRLIPDAWLCALAGAAVGAIATLTVPTSTAPSRLSLITPALLAHIPEHLPGTEMLTDRMQDIVSAAIGPVRNVTLRAGDTLSDVLVRTGADRLTAQSVADAVRDVFDPKRLQAGQELALAYDALAVEGEGNALTRLDFELNAGHSIAVMRLDDGSYEAKEIIAETRREHVRTEGAISSSLFESAQASGLPMDVLTAMVKIFSYDVDFQRDVQKGDRFEVMYERNATEDGRAVRNLNIEYAAMTLSGSPLKYYAFKQSDGSYEYYNDKGEGVRKALLRTPVNGAVLTSNFGLRRHPILGYSLMHRGVDFGAPKGTPIMAAGDGVIEKRETSGSYGNYIRIRHNGEYSTAYAHMSRFAPEFGVGKRVRQGQIIGYVGATGRATGPHLHFEVMKSKKQVNPINVKFPAAQKLDGPLLAQFRATKQKADQTFASIDANGFKVAEASYASEKRQN